MKTAIVFCLLGLGAVALARPEEKYTDRYDNLNLDEIMENRRLLIPYLKCVLGKGGCTNEGRELKSHIREALENNCRKCTENQRRGARRVLGHIINNEPEYWKLLVEKYDPDHKFTRKYEQELGRLKQAS